MAQPNSPAGDAPSGRRTADGSASATPTEPELLAPPTEEELAETGEPTAAEIHAAAADTDADTDVIRPAETEVVSPAPPETVEHVESAQVEEPTAVQAVEEPPPPAPAPPAPPAPARSTPVEPQPVLPPAEESASPAPRSRSNRLVGTAWVLLAAGVFEVLFFALNALVVLVFAGPKAVAPQVQQIAQTSLAWLPVVLFFLLFELAVLLLNRAGRVAYVFASLIIGIVVYILSAILFSLIVAHTLGDSNTLAQTFLNWEFILIGIAAREVSLWTGLAIGSRGIRVRRRNTEARARYDEETADV